MAWQIISQITQIVSVAVIAGFLVVGAGLAICFVASFIDRIGNPYDKW